MRFASPLIPAVFLRREKRFLAEVELADGRRGWVHVPNSGALTGCLSPGLEILLTREARPGRKTGHTWRFSRIPGDGWTCIDTLVPNRLVAQALRGAGLPGLPPLLSLKAEVALPPGGRLDFVADAGDRLIFLEIKSVTWVEDGVALFPDGVTSRGRRHLEHLQALVRQGHEAWQVFLVQRQDATRFRPAVQVDSDYARELARAYQRGVNIAVFQEKITPPEITLAESLPFDLIF
ncbi:MAG: DNA/RNA nuclease SfsA [Deltaproteobacteria bacterium]|nr:DNA/RNA nuclease SfsA [Deltaproteobacteria bacterium]